METQRKPHSKLKSVAKWFFIILGCIIVFAISFIITIGNTGTIETPQHDIDQDKAIVTEVAKSSTTCRITISANGEEIPIEDKDPTVCDDFTVGHDVTAWVDSLN